MAEIGDTAHPLAHDKAGVLRLRILSALMLAPVAIASVWLGPPLFSALVTLAAAGMAWEWARLCRRGRSAPLDLVLIAIVIASVLAASLHRPLSGTLVALAGSVFWAVLTRRRGEPLLAAIGVLWVTLPCIALLRLADEPQTGRATVLWILAIVWATDIGAFIIGRSVGGPRLAPRLSPNKTWSGLLGGIISAALAGAATGLALGMPRILWFVLLSGVLAIAAQLGDLAESMVKRHFGVKDSSSLIPGHGGLLDRLDGMLTVVPVVALLGLINESSVLSWQ